MFVLSDIHGEYDKLMKMLELIKFDSSTELYILGDVVDRGPKPIEALRFVMENPNIKMLKGNHEIMMLDVAAGGDPGIYLSNGGNSTVDGLTKDRDMLELIMWTNKLPFYYEVETSNNKYLLVHAGYNGNNEDYEFMTWARKEFLLSTKSYGRTIVFGHTITRTLQGGYQTSLHPDSIKYFKGKIAIDCAATFGGRLACLNLETFKEYYVE